MVLNPLCILKVKHIQAHLARDIIYLVLFICLFEGYVCY